MPLQATSGAASYDAFGGGVPVVPNYIEEVFQTWLYTGNGSTQTITNGIDLSTKGGLVWIKERSGADSGTAYHCLFDTARGVGKALYSNDTLAQSATGTALTAFNTTGFSVGTDPSTGRTNDSNDNYASWTFRKQPKFFDVLTYSGNGTAGRTVSHNLGSTPGFILVKRTDTGGSTGQNWVVWHRSAGGTGYLNSTNALDSSFPNSIFWGDGSSYVAPTSTTFTVTTSQNVNASGGTYVAYLFAHNAGGFGLTGTDNVISCGSYTGNGSATGPEVNIGYEPQWLLIKEATQSGNAWSLFDNMRGLSVSGPSGHLRPNASDAEDTTSVDVRPTATGFQPITSSGRVNRSGETFIYIAIRRGPMKVPTSGTSVFAPTLITATQSTQNVTSVGFSPDLIINGVRSNANYGQQVTDRLRGVTKQVFTEYDSSEGTTNGTALVSLDMTGFTLGSDTAGTGWNAYSGYTSVKWSFKRAPSFFDEVCYTGTGSATTVTHNLGVAPELMIVKVRSTTNDWAVYSSAIANTEFLLLDTTSAKQTNVNFWNSTSPTSSVFTVGTRGEVNASGQTFVAYLFATAAGVSKVGSYTGTGTTLQVNCGFTGGARFVLIKRTDSTGDWYVWDSARGIVAGNDPYLLFNSAAAEVTGTDYVDTYAAGFEISSTAPAGLNANGSTYIFLAIA